jgi:hypothetical protein
MSTKPDRPPAAGLLRGWLRWLAVGLLLIGVAKILLSYFYGDHKGEGRAPDGSRSETGRKPFPERGAFSGVQRPGQLKPREPSAPDPWQNGRKRE